MTDRLDEIKARWFPKGFAKSAELIEAADTEDDIRWLCDEVERRRGSEDAEWDHVFVLAPTKRREVIFDPPGEYRVAWKKIS